MLQESSGLPIGTESFFVFSKQGKNDLYVHFENTLFKDDGDRLQFSYPADHVLPGEFEEQMTRLVGEYTGNGEFLAVLKPMPTMMPPTVRHWRFWRVLLVQLATYHSCEADTMKRESQAICQALLEHHREVCVREPIPQRSACLVTYGEICGRAAVPLSQAINHFVHEVAVWCNDHHFPPLNSLVVNQDTRIPGEGYDKAPGCNLLNWDRDAERCIAFREYPANVLN